MASPAISETTLLKPIDVELLDENDWPEFPLTVAEVVDPETGHLTSVLRAGPKTPLSLVGKLGKSRDVSDNLLNNKAAKALPTKIEVSPVTQYCYGQDDEGQAIIWAAGRSGWFQIQPSRAYRAIHNQSCEAINALYFLSDFYSSLGKGMVRSTPVESTFEHYALEHPDTHPDDGQAQQMFLDHREFLIDCMNKDRERTDWKITPIYEFLTEYSSEMPSGPSSSDEELNLQTPHTMDDSEEANSRPRAGKSSLRPRSSKYSLKGVGRRHDMQNVDWHQDGTENFASPLKRKATGRNQKPRKRTIRSEDLQVANTNSASESSSEDEGLQEPELPLREVPLPQPSASRNEPRITIAEEVLPSYQPQGPGDTWTCTFDGCSYRVYEATRPENQELIREHYKNHAFESQAQIDLIYQEKRPYLPVNNLIKRIRDMATKTLSLGASDPEQDQAMAGTESSEYPKPVQRKWL